MDIRAILMGLAFAFIWSSAFTSARIIVQDAPPLMISSIRFAISGTIAVGLAFAMGQSWRLTPAQWRATVIFGICQNALYLGLNFVAMQWIEASLAAIIASTMPLLVAVLGWLAFREKIRPLGIAGLTAGFVGVALIMGSRLGGGADLLGIALCFIGALSLAVATLVVRGAISGGNVLMIVGMQMWIGALVLSVPSALFETHVINWSLPVAVALAYTVLVPGVIGTVLWFFLVARIGAIKAATFHFLNPFFGVLVATVLLSESLGFYDVVGVVIVTFGILAVQLSKQVKPTRT